MSGMSADEAISAMRRADGWSRGPEWAPCADQLHDEYIAKQAATRTRLAFAVLERVEAAMALSDDFELNDMVKPAARMFLTTAQS